MKKIDGLELTGAFTLKGKNEIKTENFFLKLSGASHLEMDINASGSVEADLSGASHASLKLVAETVDADLSGESNISLIGKTKKQKVTTSGASSYKAYDLLSKDVVVQASGASNIQLTVDDTISGFASGASNIKYKGGPSKLKRINQGEVRLRK